MYTIQTKYYLGDIIYRRKRTNNSKCDLGNNEAALNPHAKGSCKCSNLTELYFNV